VSNFLEYFRSLSNPQKSSRLYNWKSLTQTNPGLYSEIEKSLLLFSRKDKPNVIFFTDIGSLTKDTDDFLALILLISFHKQGLINLSHIVTNYYPDSLGGYFANVMTLIGGMETMIVKGSFETNDDVKYIKEFPKSLLHKDDYFESETMAGFKSMRRSLNTAPNTLLICTTALTELTNFILTLNEDQLSRIEVHIQNMVSTEGGKLVWDFGDKTRGANTAYDPIAALKLSRIVNDYRIVINGGEFLDSDSSPDSVHESEYKIPFVCTTKHLARQVKIPFGFYDSISDLNFLATYFWQHRLDCVQYWWETANGHDNEPNNPKAMTRDMMLNHIFKVPNHVDLKTITRQTKMYQYMVSLPPIYDPLTVLGAIFPGLFDWDSDDSGTFLVAGSSPTQGLPYPELTEIIFGHYIKDGFLHMPKNPKPSLTGIVQTQS
jgi:inosine-uridine nucleoside N-ribohydrolase